MENCEFPKTLKTANYNEQRESWPMRGRHIMGQYDDEGIVVYQAFNSDIAEYAVENQRFGGSKFSYDRMTWIKPNFLWMMFRSGWASKHNQERVLAIKIKLEGFKEILSCANTKRGNVRLQWDPDHYPDGSKHCYRRAIQLGVKGDILSKYGNEWILSIEDITPFVHSQAKNLDKLDELITPLEKPFTDLSPEIKATLAMDAPTPN